MSLESQTNLERIDPEKAALLVIDMQNAFCHRDGTLGISGVDVGPARGVIEPVRRLAQAFQDAGAPVIWTIQVHLDHDASRDAKALPSHTARRARVSALSGTWDAALVDEVSDLATDPTFVITKHRFGAFYQTRLEAMLDMLGTRALFVVGVTANACVETTLREAYLRDFDVIAVTDAIAAVRPQWVETAHAVWAQYLATLASSLEVHAWLSRAGRPRALRLHHLLLETADLDAAERFYLDLLGMEVRNKESFRDGRRLTTTHQGLGLTEGRSGTGSPLEHLCFEARGIDEVAERARSRGYKVVRGPGPGPYGHTVYIEDPDGNEIELFEGRASAGGAPPAPSPLAPR